MNEYFTPDLIDSIFREINKKIDQMILQIDTEGVGYTTCPNIPIKDQVPHNLFIVFRIKVVGTKDLVPVPVETYLTDIRIFQGWPASIKEKMREVEKEIANYNRAPGAGA